jgi:hypothetical protein
MFSRYFPIACIAAFLGCCASLASAQQIDRNDVGEQSARANEYVQFLADELGQWTMDFSHRFDSAMAQPPVDSSKLSEGAKAGADALGETIKRLSTLSNSKSLLNDTRFQNELGNALASAKAVNEAFGSQRFPAALQRDWAEIRTNLNNLAQIYKLETIAYLAPPEPAKAKAAGLDVVPPGGIAGYLVDQACARQGKGMRTNAECIARCVRDGEKVLFVTEDGKVYQIANPDKINADNYGQRIIAMGKTDGDTVTLAKLK